MAGRAYVDDWGDQRSDKTITVHEETREVLVRYPKPGGGWWSVKVKQKPNAIGFHARLPGDGKKTKGARNDRFAHAD